MNFLVGSNNQRQNALFKKRIRSWSPLAAKIVTLIVAVSFVFPYLSFAFSAAPYPVEVPGVYGYTPFVIQGKKLTFPPDLAKVVSSHQGNGPLTVVCIEDYHCNYEVQNEIAGLIHSLSQKNNLALVAVEGASGAVDVNPLASIPLEVIRQRVGAYFLRRGLITGAEYQTAANDKSLILHGIESKTLYDQSAALLHQFFTAQTEGWCEDLRAALNALKPAVYHQDLLRLDKKRSAYRQNRLTLQAYLRFLLEQVDKLKVNFIPSASLLAYAAQGRVMAGQPEDVDNVMDQAQAMDKALREAMYTTPDQRLLDWFQEQLETIAAMTNISATPAQLNDFLKHRADFKIVHLVNALEAMARRLKVSLFLEDDVLNLEKSIGQAAQFYQLVNRRSEAFVDNLMGLMHKNHQNLAVMITGGFHMPYVEALLKINRISFVTLKPRVTMLDQANPYFSLLQGKQSPLEKLLSKKETLFNLWTRFADPLFNKYLDLITRITSRAYRVFDHPNANQDEALQHFAEVKGLKGSLQLSSKPLLSSARGVIYAAQIDGENFVLVLRRDPKKPGHPSAAVVWESLENKDQFELLTPEQAGVRLVKGTVEVVDKDKWDGLIAGGAQGSWVSRRKLLERLRKIFRQLKQSWPKFVTRWQRSAAQWEKKHKNDRRLAALPLLAFAIGLWSPEAAGAELMDKVILTVFPVIAVGLLLFVWAVWSLLLRQMRFSLPKRGRRAKIPGVLSLHQGQKKIINYIDAGKPFVLALTDLDKLSGFNQFFGKALTDFLLDDLLEIIHQAAHMSQVTEILKKNNIHEKVSVVRYGGDEGMLVIPGAMSREERQRILDCIRDQVWITMHQQFQAFDLKNDAGSALVLDEAEVEALQKTITRFNREKKDSHFLRLGIDSIHRPRLLVKVDDHPERVREIKEVLATQLKQKVKLKNINYPTQLAAQQTALKAENNFQSLLNAATEEQHLLRGYIPTPTVSIGAMLFKPEHFPDGMSAGNKAVLLMKWADKYLEQAKEQGRNQVVLGKEIPPEKKETIQKEEGQKPLLKENIMRGIITLQNEYAVNNDVQVPMSPVTRSMAYFLENATLIARVLWGLRFFLTIVFQRQLPSEIIERPSVPKFDPLAPWQFSHAGLYAEVQTYLEKFRRGDPALPRASIVVGRARPDKMEIVVVTRGKTYLLMVEPAYQIRKEGELESGGFKIVNSQYGHGAADYIIALLHYLVRLDREGRNDLLAILTNLNKTSRPVFVVSNFRRQLERAVKRALQTDELTITPRISWIEMNTATANIGAMFADIDKANARLAKHPENKIVKFSRASFSAQDEEDYRNSITQRGVEGLLDIVAIQRDVSRKFWAIHSPDETRLRLKAIGQQKALQSFMSVIVAIALLAAVYGIFLPAPATAGLMGLAHHGIPWAIHMPGYQGVTLAMAGMVGMTMGKGQLSLNAVLVQKVEDYLRKNATVKFLSKTTKAQRLVRNFFNEWDQEKIIGFIDDLGFKPKTHTPGEGLISLGLINARSQVISGSGADTRIKELQRKLLEVTNSVEGSAIEIQGCKYHLKGIEFVALAAKAPGPPQSEALAEEIKSIGHFETASGTLKIYLFPSRNNDYAQAGLPWFSALAGPDKGLPAEIQALSAEQPDTGVPAERRRVDQILDDIKHLYLDAMDTPQELESTMAQARLLFSQLNQITPGPVQAALTEFLTDLDLPDQVKGVIWQLLPGLKTDAMGVSVLKDVCEIISKRDSSSYPEKDQNDLAHIGYYMDAMTKKTPFSAELWKPVIRVLVDSVARSYHKGDYKNTKMPLIALFSQLDHEGVLLMPLLKQIKTDRHGKSFFKADLLATLARNNRILLAVEAEKNIFGLAYTLYQHFQSLLASKPDEQKPSNFEQYKEKMLQVMSENGAALLGAPSGVGQSMEKFIYNRTDWARHADRLNILTKALEFAKGYNGKAELLEALQENQRTTDDVKRILKHVFSREENYADARGRLERELHVENEAINRRLMLLGYCGHIKSKLAETLNAELRPVIAPNVINTAAKFIQNPGMETPFIQAWVGRDIEDASQREAVQQSVKLLFYPGASIGDIMAYLRGEHIGYNEEIALLMLKRQAAEGNLALLKAVIRDQVQPKAHATWIPYFELRLMAMLEYLNRIPSLKKMTEAQRTQETNEMNELLDQLNGPQAPSQVERYIRYLMGGEPGLVAGVFNGVTPLADLKARIFATASWLDTVNYSRGLEQPIVGPEAIVAVAAKIQKARVEPFSGVFSIAYRMGGQMLRKAKNPAEMLFMALAHEHGHNVLMSRGITRTWHFMTGVLHEWVADQFMDVFANRYSISNEDVDQIRQLQQAADEIKLNDSIASKVHQGARGEKVNLREALEALRVKVVGDKQRVQWQGILRAATPTREKGLAERQGLLQLKEDDLLHASLDALQQPSLWQGSLREAFMRIFAGYLRVPFNRLPYDRIYVESKAASEHRVPSRFDIALIINELLGIEAAVQSGTAAIFFHAFLSSLDQRPATRLGKLKAWLGEPFLHAPVWETIFFTPVLLGLFLGATLPTLAGLISIQAVVFALLHPGRSAEEQSRLAALGAVLGTVIIAPALLLGLTPFSAAAGFALAVVLHSADNVRRLRPLLVGQGRNLKNPFERVWLLLIHLPLGIARLSLHLQRFVPVTMALLIISALASIAILPGPAIAATATETIKHVASQTPDMAIWLKDLLFGTVSFAALITIKTVAENVILPSRKNTSAEIDQGSSKANVIEMILNYQKLNPMPAEDNHAMPWLERLTLSWQTSRLGSIFMHWQRQLILLFGAGPWRSKLQLFFGGQPLTPVMRALAQSSWLQETDLKQLDQWGQLKSFVADWLDILDEAQDSQSKRQGVQLLALMSGKLKTPRESHYIKGIGYVSLPRWLWDDPGLSRRINHLLANDGEKMRKRQQHWLHAFKTAA